MTGRFVLKIGDHFEDAETKKYYNERAFSEIAPRYDFITRVLSFRRDAAWKRTVRRLLEEAVEKLADVYRTIFILRDVEDMSTTDAAEVLDITEDNVKVRLHRARALLRKSLYARAGMERKEAFSFHAVRCDRVVMNVFERIQKHLSNTDDSTARVQ
jgi:DNA-directed RNA polymerase specialized sigma24 family protein